MTVQISAVTLGVKDLQVSKSFYKGIGATVEQEHPSFISLKLAEASPILGLYPRDGLAETLGVSPKGSGFTGVKFDYNPPGKGKNRVDELLSKVEGAGGTIVKPAHETEWGGRVGIFRDPDENLWQVASY